MSWVSKSCRIAPWAEVFWRAPSVRGAVATDDLRGPDPRLHGDNVQRNLALVAALEEMATARGATPAQLALAWLLAQGDDVVPIPGVEKRELLRQNLGAVGLEFRVDELAALDRAFAPGVASGNPDATLLRKGTGVDRPR